MTGGSTMALDPRQPFYSSQSNVGTTIEALAGNRNQYEFSDGATGGHRTTDLQRAGDFIDANIGPAEIMLKQQASRVETEQTRLGYMQSQFDSKFF